MFYAQMRKIPKENIIYISTEPTFAIERTLFEKEIRDPIKSQLLSAQHKHIKVLTTTYDIPLKIHEISPATQNVEIKKQLIAQIENTLKDFQSACKELDLLVQAEKLSLPTLHNRSDIKPTEILSTLQTLWSRISTNPAEDPTRKKEITKIIATMLGVINPIIPLDSAGNKIVAQSKESLNKIDPLSTDFSTAQLSTISQNAKILFGLTGQISSLKSIFDRLFGEHTSASVDSELVVSLLHNIVPISHRVPNPLFLEIDSLSIISDPIILVSRIDGPHLDNVKKNIIETIRVEKTGTLKGTFLIDSRGSSFDDRSELATWDRKLTLLAKSNFGNSIDIEFDATPSLAEEVNNLALYLGWYSLRNYKDSYTFAPGAIGYHIASEEAVHIHDPQEKGWCKNLLERGVVTTIGAVDEPYVDSFPHPEYFFPLLHTGEFNVVEIYYMTTKYLSWRHILFSDPLYNPYKNHPEKIAISELNFKTMPPISTRMVNRKTF